MNFLRHWWIQWNGDWVKDESPDWRSALAALVGAIILFPLVNVLPALGFDWFTYFWARDFNQYPPWTEWVLTPLLTLFWRDGVALLNGLLMMTVAIATAREVYQRAGNTSWAVTNEALGAATLALLSPSVWILLWVVNIESVALFGSLFLPFGLPFILLKPHLYMWAILSRRTWFLWAAIFGVGSLLIWGLWPLNLMESVNGRIQHPSAFGWSGVGLPMILIGVLLLAFTNADPLRLMAVGSFLSPFLMPQHFVLLLPALGRVRGWKRLGLWAGAWLMAIPVMFGAWMNIKYLALGFPLLIWWMLRPDSK